MATWRKLIQQVMAINGDQWGNIEMANIGANDNVFTFEGGTPDPSWNREFDNGHGIEEGDHFIVWTKNYIYFPVCYDGGEWVESIPRNPIRDYVQEHIGG